MWLEWDITSWKKSDTQLKSSWLFKNKVFWWGMFYLTIFKLILLKYETQFALESTLFRTNQKSNCKWFHYMRKKIKYGSKLLLRDKDSKLSAISVYFLLIWQGFFFLLDILCFDDCSFSYFTSCYQGKPTILDMSFDL